MTIANEFFLIFLVTILLARSFLFFKPISSPTIKSFRLHHYMYGIVLVVLGLILKSVAVYAVGAGLFVDELTYLLIKEKTHADNYSRRSIVGAIIFVFLVFVFRKYLVAPFI